MNRKFVVQGDLIQEVINYLQEKPFKEVAGLIQALAASPPYIENTKD